MNWSLSHLVCALQSRSVLAVGVAFSYSVPLHVVTATHALPSLTLENAVPTTHAAHLRSAIVEPASDWPSPFGHVAQAEQLSVASVVLVPALKRPAPHSAHVRSLLALAATVVRKPLPHGALTSWHAVPSLTFENVAPAVQPWHSRSAIAEPVLRRPWPTGHVDHVVQRSVASVELVPDLKAPASHGLHSTSLLAVAATVVYDPGPQAELTARHVALLSTFEYVDPAAQEVHWRSAVLEPGLDRPLPVEHVDHVVQLSLASVPELGPALNCPDAHFAHERSLLVVAIAVVR